jgi:SAM-dependent methyltransferase
MSACQTDRATQLIVVITSRVGRPPGKDLGVPRTFEDLVAEADSVSVDGWDFSWLAGRATEERPSWGYARMMAGRMAQAGAALDIQTGGGEVLAGIPQPPSVLAATESWPPNVEIARRNLAPLGGRVVQVADDAGLPFPAESFDLVVSRHPVELVWPEIARVLRPGGTFLSQLVGAGSNRELSDFMMGPQPVRKGRSTDWARAQAETAGLAVADLREQALRTVFNDVGAVAYFLRKVLWTVPGFTVAGYRDPLRRLHGKIQSEGPFVAHAQRVLIEARKP